MKRNKQLEKTEIGSNEPIFRSTGLLLIYHSQTLLFNLLIVQTFNSSNF